MTQRDRSFESSWERDDQRHTEIDHYKLPGTVSMSDPIRGALVCLLECSVRSDRVRLAVFRLLSAVIGLSVAASITSLAVFHLLNAVIDLFILVLLVQPRESTIKSTVDRSQTGIYKIC